MSNITVGLDIAKNVFHAVVMDNRGNVKTRKLIRRSQVSKYFANHEAATVVIEACGSSNYWARVIQKLGHEVKLIPPQHVVAYRRKGKNDYNDAEAIAEASQRPNMTFVPIKTIAQQELQSLLRVRERKISDRTRIANQIQGLAAEFGVALNKGKTAISKHLPMALEDIENELTPSMRGLLSELRGEYLQIDDAIKWLDKKISSITANNEVCKRALTVPGIGPINAATIYASIGNGQYFKNGRHFAAWCGLVPKQNSTGGKNNLGGITKRGNSQIRQLLVHGARSALTWAAKRKEPDNMLNWALMLKTQKHHNKATVALANKMARVVWAVIANEQPYKACR